MADDDTTINIRLEDEGGKPQGSVDPLKGAAAREPTPPVAASVVPPSSERSEVKDKQLGDFQKINLGHIRTIQQIARTVAGMAGFNSHFLNSIFRLSVLAEKFGSVLNKTQAAAEAAGDAARRAGHGRPKEPVPRPSQLPPSGVSPSPRAPTSAPVTTPSRPPAEPVRGEGERPRQLPAPHAGGETGGFHSMPFSRGRVRPISELGPVAGGEGKTPWGHRVPRTPGMDSLSPAPAKSKDPVSPASPSAPRLPAPQSPSSTPIPLHGAKPVPPSPAAAAGGGAAGGAGGASAAGAAGASGAAGAAAGALSLARLVAGLTLAGAAIGTVVSGFAALVIAARRLDSAFDRATNELEGFSPDISVASAERDIGNLIAKMNQAEELGPMLAAQESIRAEQDLLKIQIQTKILKLLGPINEMLQESYVVLLGMVNQAVELSEKAGGLKGLGDIGADIAGVPESVQLGVKALLALLKLAKDKEEEEVAPDYMESIIVDYLSPQGVQAATSGASHTFSPGMNNMTSGKTPRGPTNILSPSP